MYNLITFILRTGKRLFYWTLSCYRLILLVFIAFYVYFYSIILFLVCFAVYHFCLPFINLFYRLNLCNCIAYLKKHYLQMFLRHKITALYIHL